MKESAEKKTKDEKAKKEYNPWNILEHPHLTEKSMNLVEIENKLVFTVTKTRCNYSLGSQ